MYLLSSDRDATVQCADCHHWMDKTDTDAEGICTICISLSEFRQTYQDLRGMAQETIGSEAEEITALAVSLRDDLVRLVQFERTR